MECVPNVSEGRNALLVEDMGRSMRSVGGKLLDVHSDPDHHRTVFTVVGRHDEMSDVLCALTERTLAGCDLCRHVGAHPRTGLLDVVPFIPLGLTSMDDCIGMAVEVGRTLAEMFRIPVLLYGEAARRSSIRSLGSIRRGGMADLAHRLAVEGPDFGPSALHPRAGAVLVGARRFLVAFNVLLESSDLHVAQAIAATVRGSGGGLRGLQALGFYLESRDRSQVSMNLTDVSALSVVEVFRAVEAEAQRHGISVMESELVGLAPESALQGATSEALKMRFDPQLASLERRLEMAYA